MDGYTNKGFWSVERTFTSSFWQGDTYAGHPPNNTSTSSLSTVIFSASFGVTGFRNPKWRDQVRLGQNATTPFNGTKYSGSATYGSCTAYASSKTYQLSRAWSNYGFLFGYPTFPSSVAVDSSIVNQVTNRCLRKFNAKVNAALSSNNLTGRSIRHFKHDVHSLIHPMTSIRGSINTYLGNLEKASSGIRRLKRARWLNALREEYLQFTFGTAPFVEDVTAILVDSSHRRFPIVPVSASANIRYSGTSTVVPINGALNMPGAFHVYVSVTNTYSVSIKGAVRTQSGMDGKIGFIQSQRLTPRDWVPTLFSILPYAWMVDYFTNVGDILDGLAFPYSSLAWSSATNRRVSKVVYYDPIFTMNSFPGYDMVNSQSSGGSANFEYEAVNRFIPTAFDFIPHVQFNLPTSPKKIVNLMAVFQPRIFKLVSRVLSKL